MSTTLKIIYTFFLAILVALFVGLGIAAFYPSPKQPEYPTKLERPLPVDEKSPAAKARQKELDRIQRRFDREMKTFRKRSAAYNRDVSVISLIGAIIILIISLTLFKKILIISDGLLLGGVFTLAYSIVRGFAGENEMFRFVIVTVGLAITIALGYIKFLKPAADQEAKV